MNLRYEQQSENDDVFDRVPDSLIHLIFNRISDVKTLIRCRSVSRRFSSLVPQADTLLLRVDRVVSATDPADADSALLTFLRSIFKPILDLVSPKPIHDPARSQRSPAQILRGFDRIRELYLELPSGDLRLEKGAVIRWRAEFGKTLRSCVILGFRTGAVGGGGDLVGGGLKMRVVWTITALIAASARHYYMVREVVREHEGVERVVVGDREGEGTVVMERDGVRECRESLKEVEEEEEGEVSSGGGNRRGVWWGRSNRTKVPAVRMRMRHVPRLELSGGMRMEGATLVVVKPINGGGAEAEEEEEISGSAGLAFGGGVYGEAVEKLLKTRSYILEMNSF